MIVQRLIALVAIAVLSPLMLVLAIMVVADSGLPIFYRGIRVGLNGRLFQIFKLRTMRRDVAGSGVTVDDDPRITRIGRRLRRHRLDELPQLWNVVVGDMALVGPRPEAPQFVDHAERAWSVILSVRPGLTGPTQLRHLDEAVMLRGDDPDGVYRREVLPGKIASDVAYVRGRSVRGDLSLLVATARALVGPREASR